jgi:hypothetical protein
MGSGMSSRRGMSRGSNGLPELIPSAHQVYDRVLPKYRAWLRRILVARLRAENEMLANLQVSIGCVR